MAINSPFKINKRDIHLFLHILYNVLANEGASYNIVGYVFTYFPLHLKTNKRSFRGVVNGLRNILYFFIWCCNSLYPKSCNSI